MSAITVDSLTADEPVASRSRTFSPEVVAKVNALFNPPEPAEGEEAAQPSRNVGIGTFEKEGAARSALASLNKLLKEAHGSGPYASTVRQTEDNKFKAVLLNKPAKKAPQAQAAETPAETPAQPAQRRSRQS